MDYAGLKKRLDKKAQSVQPVKASETPRQEAPDSGLSLGAKIGEFGIGAIRAGEQAPRLIGNVLGYANQKIGEGLDLVTPGLGTGAKKMAKQFEKYGTEITEAGETDGGAVNLSKEQRSARRAGGELALTAPIPAAGFTKLAQAGRIGLGGAVAGAQFGAMAPIMEKGSKTKVQDIAVGTALGAAGGAALAKGGQMVWEWLGKLTDYVTKSKNPSLFTKQIDDESKQIIHQAFRPSTSGIDSLAKFEKQQDKLLEGTKQIVRNGKTPKTAQEALEAARETRENIWKQAELNNAAVTKQTTGEEIANDIRSFVLDADNKAFFRANPKSKEKLIEYADEVQNNPDFSTLSQDDLQTLLTDTNAKIPSSSFLKQLDANPTETQTNTVVARILRDRVERNLEEAIGQGSQELRNAYGAVRELEKTLAKRYGVFLRQNPKLLVDIMSMDAIPDILLGLASGSPTQVLKGFGKKAIAYKYKQSNDPNQLISELFGKQSKIVRKGDGSLKIPLTGKSEIGEFAVMPEKTPELPAGPEIPRLPYPRTPKGTVYGNPDYEIYAGSAREAVPKPKQERPMLPAPRTPETGTLPRTDVSAESMRGIDFSKVKTMDTRVT